MQPLQSLTPRLDVERNRVHVHRESPPHVIGPFSQAIDAKAFSNLIRRSLTSCWNLARISATCVSHHVLMLFVISVRFLTSLCKDRSNTAICCCIVNDKEAMMLSNSSFSLRCLLACRLCEDACQRRRRRAQEAMMDSRRLVVSSAASCLLSWRLAVFIFRGLSHRRVGLLGGCPLLGLLAGLVLPHSWWGIRASCVARRVDSNGDADLAAALAEAARRCGR